MRTVAFSAVENGAQVHRYIDRLQALLPRTDSAAEDRRHATVALSTLVGALLLARAVDQPALADEILSTARAALLNPAQTEDR